jgi:DNA-binding NarL/FixJ family response regulator
MNVLIVDDHPLIQEYLRGAVARAFPDAVVRSVGTLREALEEAKERLPELVLLDLGLPDAKGLESILRFREAQPQVSVVVVSGEDDGDSVRGALALGAAGFVPKTSGPKVLLNALRLVAEGGRYIPPEALAELEPGPPRADGAASAEGRLTKRQREILACLLTGLSNAQIAKALRIEETTVRQHAHAVYSAFGVSTRAELMAAARQRGTGSG